MWIVSWRWNGISYMEIYDTYEYALIRSIELDYFGKQTSIHFAEDSDEKISWVWSCRLGRLCYRNSCSCHIHPLSKFLLVNVSIMIAQLIYNLRIRFYAWKHRHDSFLDQLDRLWQQQSIYASLRGWSIKVETSSSFVHYQIVIRNWI